MKPGEGHLDSSIAMIRRHRAEAQAKLKEQDTLIGDYLAELRDKERKAQKNISAPSEVRPTRRQKPSRGPRRLYIEPRAGF